MPILTQPVCVRRRELSGLGELWWQTGGEGFTARFWSETEAIASFVGPSVNRVIELLKPGNTNFPSVIAEVKAEQDAALIRAGATPSARAQAAAALERSAAQTAQGLRDADSWLAPDDSIFGSGLPLTLIGVAVLGFFVFREVAG